MKKIVKRKSMQIRFSGRSSDYITPSFGHGCLYKCSYCYMRRNKYTGLSIASNTDEIIKAIDDHINTLVWPKTPNQTHNTYFTYDFSCNEDYVLHAKFHEWQKLFEFFKQHPKAMGTAATKYVNTSLLSYNPDKKVRIRFSLMPQELSNIFEPKTSKIIDRIQAINDFSDAGYDVHVNYSPVILHDNCGDQYRRLFELVDKNVKDSIKDDVKAEVIFLTHNEGMHKLNVANGVPGEEYLFRPEIQEAKVSSYGGRNIRYQRAYKAHQIKGFKALLKEYVPWQEIRYIF